MPTVLLAVAYTVVAVLGVGAVLTRDPLRQVMVNGVFGLALVLLFTALQAPDVAMSEVVVSTVAFPVVLLVAIQRVRSAGNEREEE